MIFGLFESLDKNRIFSGGLTLMFVGSAVALLRTLPGRLWAFVERRISISLEISERDPCFRWVQNWLAAHPRADRTREARRLFTWFYRDSGLDDGELARAANDFAGQVSRTALSMAAIQAHLLRHRGAPRVAAREALWDELPNNPLIPTGTNGGPHLMIGCPVGVDGII